MTMTPTGEAAAPAPGSDETRGAALALLPGVITAENKYVAGLFTYLVAAAMYLVTNHFHLVAPQMLPMSWVDQRVPFVPQTVWIYTSEYLLFATVYIALRDVKNLNRFLYSFLSLQSVSVLIFILWPTTYPRDLFPLLEDRMDALTYLLFSSLRQTDSPASCCPSLHVSSCYLLSMLFLNERHGRGKFIFFFVWASAVAATTLTTKQHYLIDVVTGLLMAIVFHWIFAVLLDYRVEDGLQAKR